MKKTLSISAVLLCLAGGPFAVGNSGGAAVGGATAPAPTASRQENLCSRDVMCIVSVARGDEVDVYIDNRQSAEITVTLDPVLRNMHSSVAFPYTETVPGSAKTKLFSLKIADARADHSYRHTYKWTWGSMHAVHDDEYVYTLPYAPGQFYRVDQGYNGAFSHYGDFTYAIDWNMPIGSPVHAAREGIVVAVKDEFDVGGPDRRFENFCNYIMIKHADGTIGEYDHLQAFSAKVKVGDVVRAGDRIAASGNSGFTTGPHLHFFVYKAVDGGKRQSFPLRFKLDENTAGAAISEGRTYTAF